MLLFQKTGKRCILPATGRVDMEGLISINRKESVGGDWGPAMNLGPVINSKYNEETPFIHR